MAKHALARCNETVRRSWSNDAARHHRPGILGIHLRDPLPPSRLLPRHFRNRTAARWQAAGTHSDQLFRNAAAVERDRSAVDFLSGEGPRLTGCWSCRLAETVRGKTRRDVRVL